jgi:cobalt ECF transporter T component CbiQ
MSDEVVVARRRAVTAPDWLVRPEVGLCPCGCVGRRRKTSYVEKTLRGASDLVQTALVSDEVSAAPGLLQRLDPRVKVVTLFGLLAVAALVHHVAVLAALYSVVVGLAFASRIPVRRFAARVWLVVPLFTGIVVVPAMLNVVTPGRVVLPLGTWFGHEIGITSQGVNAAALLVARVGVSVSLVLLLTLTTPWPRVLGALRALFVPRAFVEALAMAHRYVYQLLATVQDMFTARKARSAGERHAPAGRAFVAASAGALFGKSYALSEEVHQAMVARGYRGEAVSLATPMLGVADVVWVAWCVATAVVMLGGDHVLAH